MHEDLSFLIVDDDPSTINALTQLLTRLGVRKITTATSGYDAFAVMRANRRRFDYIISDVCMAQGNGLELLYQIRTSTVGTDFRPDMCVILMSGVASPDIAFTASRLDVNGFLVKPFSLIKLQAAIAQAPRRAFQLNRDGYYKVTADKLRVA